MVVHEYDPFSAEPPPGALAGAVLTKLDSFCSRNHGPIPEFDPETWDLRSRCPRQGGSTIVCVSDQVEIAHRVLILAGTDS